ncbi:activating signal cointegrator 1 complex subunit 2 [Culicoides brevitarsis]|uniref:activating signal cointegrator 1 complex subunit 2 n=1 Tax=Culicoides brevitarsis TaxID=469753 RepID=UPI00307C9918
MCASSMVDEKWPLNERKITITVDGRDKQIPALDAYWCEKRPISKYYPFPAEKGNLTSTKYDVLVEEWIKDTTDFNEDLIWLLQLEHHRFWSKFVFDSNVIQAVLSFLQEATPCYTPISAATSNENALKLYGQVLKHVVTIVCRLVTAKESETEWIGKEALGEMLYTNYLVSIPMIFDLAIALGPENGKVLNKIIAQMIKIQPKYHNDLLNGLEYVQASIRSVEDQAQTMIQKEIDGNAPDSHGLEMLTLYALDCIVTLSVLLEAFPEAKVMSNDAGLALTLTQFYDNSIPLLYKMTCENDKNEVTLKYLSRIRLEILNTFHGIANHFLELLMDLEPTAGQSIAEISEKIITLFEESLDDATFVIDYQKIFPVENDLDVIRQANGNLNALRMDYIQVGYRDAHRKAEKNVETEEILNGNESEPDLEATESEGAYGRGVSAAQEVPLTEEETKIRQILEVFPDYGDGFIRKVLLRYDMNPESVIAAILEGNLPPDLATMDTSEPYIPPEQSEFFVETGIKRLNIYDGDEFDVMTNNPNVKGIYKKGVNEPKKWDALLNDKTHIQENKAKYSELGYVEEIEYDDEYDDSYDAMAESEAKTMRYKPAANFVMDEESSESSEEEENSSLAENRDKKNDFCENPEVIRARYEAMRQRKFANKGGGMAPKHRDVVGKPKGQGQDEETNKNRHKKGVNKSVTGNHNRKRGADFKRSKGMF